ncbi:MAG: chemotaxis protein CheA [Desulfitobacteriaceae bacterium]
MSTLDTSQYMGLFLSEVEEQLNTLNQSILSLEQLDSDSEVLQRLFRVAHTLKGSSATMGLDIMAELTHHLEDILDDVRHGKAEVSLPLVDALFACLDQLQTWHDELAAGAIRLQPAPELLERLEKVRSGFEEKINLTKNSPEIVLTEDIVEQSKLYFQQGWWVGAVSVRLEEDCLMPAVRAYLAYNNAQEWGEVLATSPATDSLTEGEWRGHLTIWVALPSENEIQGIYDSIMEISEIAEVTLKKWSPELNQLVPEQNEPEVRENNGVEPRKIKKNTMVERGSEGKEKKTSETDNSGNKTASKNSETNDYVRIEVNKLDALMDLLGELVIDRARLNQIETELANSFGGEITESLGEVSRHIATVSSELQERLLKLRMSPMSQVYARFPRMVRDLAHQLGKEVDFILEGEETELDRSVIQNISEPLIHLLRNSIDHGLESPKERASSGKTRQGKLTVRTEQMGGEILISVQDDGKGIDTKRLREIGIERGWVSTQEELAAKDADVLQWIFQSGFSTRNQISEVSGRGVGMDVVRHAVEKMHGRVELESVVGLGTLTRITLPLTLAVIRALLFEVGSHPYTIPLGNVLETLRLRQDDIFQYGSRWAIVLRGRTIPLINMRQWCEHSSEAEVTVTTPSSYISIVLVASGARTAGLVVDRFCGEQEVVVKPLGHYLGNPDGFIGATLLGDGRVSLIFDIPALLRGIEVFS